MLAGASRQSACTSLVPGPAPRGRGFFFLATVFRYLCALPAWARARFLCAADEG